VAYRPTFTSEDDAVTARTKRLADMERNALDGLPDEALDAMWDDFAERHPDLAAAADALLSVATDAELERVTQKLPLSPAVLDRLDVNDTERARLLTLLTQWGAFR
jgi:hypothetical protein